MPLQGWEKLLERALDGIHALEQNGTPMRWWSFGGGTALMVHHQHRNSKDIDLFIGDPQYLTILSPRLGGESIWDNPDYDEAAHYLKLRYEDGEIDFIVSDRLTDLPLGTYEFDDRPVPIEHPVEIAVKKLYHRAEYLKPRDVFDVAVVLTEHEDALRYQVASLDELMEVKDLLMRRLEGLPQEYYEEALDELDISEKWEFLKPVARDMVTALVQEIPPPVSRPSFL
jgi:hypothetical protein